jgi:hypothetical protein
LDEETAARIKSVAGKRRSKYFGYFDFTIENQSEHWDVVKVESVRFDGVEDPSAIRFPKGDTLERWQSCMAKLLQIEDYNNELALGTVAGIGLIAAATSENRAVSDLGAAAAIGSAAYAVGSAMGKERDSSERLSLGDGRIPPQAANAAIPFRDRNRRHQPLRARQPRAGGQAPAGMA